MIKCNSYFTKKALADAEHIFDYSHDDGPEVSLSDEESVGIDYHGTEACLYYVDERPDVHGPTATPRCEITRLCYVPTVMLHELLHVVYSFGKNYTDIYVSTSKYTMSAHYDSKRDNYWLDFMRADHDATYSVTVPALLLRLLAEAVHE